MVSNPNDAPPAFRGRQPGKPSFVGMEDDQVLKIAANALRTVQALPLRSRPRAEQWREFDAAMGELSSRAVVYALAKIHELHELEEQ